MQAISLQDIDQIRQNGFRPQIIGCIIFNKQILFVYKEKYKLWQLPQGGIDNNENIKKATIREMTEELGISFTKLFQINKVIGEDKLIFPKRIQGSRKMQTDNDQEIFMLGKKYFFVLIKTINKNLDITKTEFNDYKWLKYKNALTLAKNIPQLGKKKIILKVISILHKQNIL